MRPEVNLYIESTFKGPARRDGKVIYLLECQRSDGTPHTKSEIIIIEAGTENQANLTAIITALKRVNQPCFIRVFTRCEHILNTIQNGWHLVWKENNWCNAKGKPVKNADLWEGMLLEFDKHTFSFSGSSHEYTNWMKRELDN